MQLASPGQVLAPDSTSEGVLAEAVDSATLTAVSLVGCVQEPSSPCRHCWLYAQQVSSMAVLCGSVSLGAGSQLLTNESEVFSNWWSARVPIHRTHQYQQEKGSRSLPHLVVVQSNRNIASNSRPI